MGSNKNNGIKAKHYNKTIVALKDEALTDILIENDLYDEWLTLDAEDRPNDPDAPNIVDDVKACTDRHTAWEHRTGRTNLPWHDPKFHIGGMAVK